MNPEVRPDIQRFPRGKLDIQLIVNQYAELMPHVQAGVQSRGFKGGAWSEQESRLRHMHLEIDRYIDGEKWDRRLPSPVRPLPLLVERPKSASRVEA